MTPDDSEELTIELMAEDLLALISHIGFKRIHLLGFSMGGIISQALVCHPEARAVSDGVVVRGITVCSLVLAGTFCKSPKTTFNPSKMCVAADSPNTEGMPKEKRDRTIVEYMLGMQYDEESLRGPLKAQFDKRVDLSLSTRRPMMTVMSQSVAIGMYSSREALAELGKKNVLRVALIHGRRDQMVDYSESEELASLVPGASRLVPAGGEGYGHMWFEYFDLGRDWVAMLDAWCDARRARL